MIRAFQVISAADTSTAANDSIALDFSHRHRRRMTMTTNAGKTFLLELKKAVALADGDFLKLDDGTLVAVQAKPERVAEIRADDPMQLIRIAWHLGNRHLPTQIMTNRLRILDDHVIVGMVRGLGAHAQIIDAPFQPEGGAYTQPHDHE